MELFRHLGSCRQCFDTYMDSAIYCALLSEDTQEFDARTDLMEEGLHVAIRNSFCVRVAWKIKDLFSRGPAGNPARYVLAAASLVLLLVSSLYFSERDWRSGDIPAHILGPVVDAVKTASSRGPLVIPGGENTSGSVSSEYRSGYVPIDDRLSSSFHYLSNAFQDDDLSTDEALWLIAGYVATGQIDIARDLAAYSRKHGINDVRLDNLEAIIVAMDGDYKKSDSLYREILAAHPDDAVAAINFAVVLSDNGHGKEAMKLLELVIDQHPGTWLAQRAGIMYEAVNNR